MNTDILEGKWKQLRGSIKEKWGKLTDDDLDKVAGEADRLAGLLQQKYGYARDQAEEAIKRLHDDHVYESTGKSAPTRGIVTILVGALLAGMTLAGCTVRDSGLTAEVKSKLIADETVKAAQIEVTTKAQVVTLTGNVNSQAEKDRAILLARNTKGVRDVADMISVKTSAHTGDAPEPPRTLGEKIDDAAITMAVKGRLLDDPQMKALKIDVDTREGVVFLTGSVSSKAERDHAVELAKNTEHVRKVVTNLTVQQG